MANYSNPSIYTFVQAKTYLGNKSDRPLHGRSTRLQSRGDDKIAVRYHDTDIVTYLSNGDIVLDSGGWRTPTTKGKMSEYIGGWRGGWGVSQVKGLWFVYRHGTPEQPGITVGFADGITLHPDGTITGFAPESDKQAEKKLRAAIRKYAQNFTTALLAGKIGAPSSGDCLLCNLDRAALQQGKIADPGDSEHIRSHIDESYFVPSLLINAMDEMGASIMDRQTVHELMHGVTVHETFKGWLARDISSILRRYLYRKLGTGAT